MKKKLIRSGALDQERLFWWNLVMKIVFSVIKKPWVVRFLNSNCVAKHSFGRSFCFVLLFKKMKENFEKPFWTNVFLKTTWEKFSHKKIPSICNKKIKTQFSWRRLVFPDNTEELKQHQLKNYQRNIAKHFQTIFSLTLALCNSRIFFCCLVEKNNYSLKFFFPVRQLTHFKKQKLLGSVKQLWPEKKFNLVVYFARSFTFFTSTMFLRKLACR